MKNLTSISLLSILLVPVFVFPVLILYFGKEFYPLTKVIATQKKDSEIVFGTAYNGETSVPYKLALLREFKPDVILTGTSLMLSFRKEFFKKNTTFINASVPGPQLGNIYNISYFVNELPNDGKKRVLIIALDPTLFTIDHGKKGMEKYELQEGSFLRKLIRIPGINLRLIYRDNLGYFFSLDELQEKIKDKKDIGFSALVYQNGYRIDGSFRDMVSLRNPPNQNGITAIQIHKKIEEFEKSSSHEYFEHDTTKIIKNNLQHLSDLLDLCTQKNITVIGLIPPSPTLVAQVFYSTSTLFGERNRQLRKDEMEIFARHGFQAYDLSNINLYGASNFEFLDALHGTDLLFARAALYLAVNKKDPTLAPLLDTKALREMIKKAKGGFLIF